MNGFAFPRMARRRAFNPLWNHYRCGDDQWLALGMLQADRYWADFCRAVGRPELAEDARFADMGTRAQNAEAAVAELLDEVFAQRPRAEWLDVLRKGGDFIFMNSVDELADDPQVPRQRLRGGLRASRPRLDPGRGHPRAPVRDAGKRARGGARARPAHGARPHRAARLRLGPDRGTAQTRRDLTMPGQRLDVAAIADPPRATRRGQRPSLGATRT